MRFHNRHVTFHVRHATSHIEPRPSGSGVFTVLLFFLAIPSYAQQPPWSFRNHVIPVTTKMGCNSGACHGALAGKNGQTTLRGYDPDVDFVVLTRQPPVAASTREPARSLMFPADNGHRMAAETDGGRSPSTA